MLGHLNGSPCRHWGATICHTEHFHGLALRSPLAMPVQHRGIHTLPGRVYLIPGGQVLILMAWIPFFPIQEEEINHLFLILLLR